MSDIWRLCSFTPTTLRRCPKL